MSEEGNPLTAPRRLSGVDTEVHPLGVAGSFGIQPEDVERAFHELGTNYFFFSPRMKGLVEGLRRLIRAGHRDRMVLAGGSSLPTGGRVQAAFEKQARMLGTDHIDVFHVFWVQARWYVTGKTWPAMQALKQEGKVKALAISIHDRTMARELTGELDLDVLMCRYNAAHRGAEGEIFEAIPAPRPSVVAYTATRWGRLLKPAGDLGPATAGECYRFTLGHPRVSVALCGAKNFAELAENVAALEQGPLTSDEHRRLIAFGDRVRSTATGTIGFAGI